MQTTHQLTTQDHPFFTFKPADKEISYINVPGEGILSVLQQRETEKDARANLDDTMDVIGGQGDNKDDDNE